MSSPGLSRRAWLTSALHKAGEVVAQRVEDEVARRLPAEHRTQERRPPGAVSEPLFLTLCERCGECASACPHAAILTYPEDAGARAHTPAMRPERRPCHLCDGYPCIAACPSGALRQPDATLPRESQTWSLGTVALDTERCFAYSGPECGACVGLCPRGLEAMRLVKWRPELDGEACVGCGLCIEACPMTQAAISMEPARPGDLGWREEELDGGHTP